MALVIIPGLNHQMYGFEGEVKAKYSSTMVELFTEVYNWLPLSHCINSRILVMHGGLFKEVLPNILKMIRLVNLRFGFSLQNIFFVAILKRPEKILILIVYVSHNLLVYFRMV